jgi:hypothetical protein
LKQGLNPAIAAVVIVVVVAIAGYFIWKGASPRSDGPAQPVNMGSIIGKDKIAPPTNPGRARMGGGTAR